jgi:hypothetical protein
MRNMFLQCGLWRAVIRFQVRRIARLMLMGHETPYTRECAERLNATGCLDWWERPSTPPATNQLRSQINHLQSICEELVLSRLEKMTSGKGNRLMLESISRPD